MVMVLVVWYGGMFSLTPWFSALRSRTTRRLVGGVVIELALWCGNLELIIGNGGMVCICVLVGHVFVST